MDEAYVVLPDREKAQHSRTHAVLVIHLATMTTGIAALVLYKVSDWTGAFFLVALVLCVLAIIGLLETVGRRSVERERILRNGMLHQTSSAPDQSVEEPPENAKAEPTQATLP